jgi:ADP-heptose:LPS heptosyltransferase
VGIVQAVKGASFSSIAALESLFKLGRSGKTKPLWTIRNFLLLQYPTALGTAVHATPLIPALREAVPGCRIVVAASGMALEIFRNHPGVDRVMETPSPLRDLKGAIRSLRAQNLFHGETFAVLTAVGNERTLIGLQGFLSGAAVRVGFTEVPQLYRVPLERDVRRSLIDNNLRMVEAFGYSFKHFEPEIFITKQDAAYARELLVESGVVEGRPVAVFVTQNSGGQRTGWHTDRFTQVIRHAAERLGYSVVYVGTARDAEAIEAIRRAAGGIGVSVAGKTNITQLAALLAMSDVAVSLDTGTMHVGRAAKVPMVVLGPSWQKPIEWLPLEIPNVRILRGEGRDTIPENYQLDEISAEGVIAALDDLFGVYPPREEERRARIEQSVSSVTHRTAG